MHVRLNHADALARPCHFAKVDDGALGVEPPGPVLTMTA